MLITQNYNPCNYHKVTADSKLKPKIKIIILVYIANVFFKNFNRKFLGILLSKVGMVSKLKLFLETSYIYMRYQLKIMFFGVRCVSIVHGLHIIIIIKKIDMHMTRVT